jgi:hypothetical protein
MFEGFGLGEVGGVLNRTIVLVFRVIHRRCSGQSGGLFGSDLALQQASKPRLRAVDTILTRGWTGIRFQRPLVFGLGGNRTRFLGEIVRWIAHGS